MRSADNPFTDGAAYERLMGRWSKVVGREFLDWLAPPPNLRWLDVGCGTGAFTAELMVRCSPRQVTAIDPAEDQLAFARARQELHGVEFHRGEGEALRFDDGSFDAAVMALVIHFVPDPATAVAEMARVVRPGGWVTSYAWDYTVRGSPTAPLFSALKSIDRPTPGPPSPHATGLKALRELWLSAALSDIETKVISIFVSFPDFEEFWNSMTLPVGPAGKAIAQLEPRDVARLRSALREQVPAQGDGSVRYEATANAIRGRVPQ